MDRLFVLDLVADEDYVIVDAAAAVFLSLIMIVIVLRIGFFGRSSMALPVAPIVLMVLLTLVVVDLLVMVEDSWRGPRRSITVEC